MPSGIVVLPSISYMRIARCAISHRKVVRVLSAILRVHSYSRRPDRAVRCSASINDRHSRLAGLACPCRSTHHDGGADGERCSASYHDWQDVKDVRRMPSEDWMDKASLRCTYSMAATLGAGSWSRNIACGRRSPKQRRGTGYHYTYILDRRSGSSQLGEILDVQVSSIRTSFQYNTT